MAPSPAEPRRLRGWLGETFVVEHVPASTPKATAVVILPSLGYEDTCAYRPLRTLADALAAQGHPVVRLDWPGLGDSGGDDATDELVPKMCAAAAEVAASLRARGASVVTAVALRTGGLLALASGAFDELVLWAPPASGKAAMREERAFHKMAERYFGEPPGGVPALPAGDVEAGGFRYRAETVAAIERLKAEELAVAHPVRRALLLARDGGEPPAALLAALRASGAQVQVGPAEGLADLLEDPYQSTLAPGVRDAVVGFFRDAPAGAPLAPTQARPTHPLPDGGREQVWVEAGDSGELSGIVTEPAGGARPGAEWTVFFNAGGVRRAGPNRLWTRAARALAAAGRPSLRFDVHDVGDSDGAYLAHEDLDEMYAEPTVLDAVRGVDSVRARGAGPVDVVGLCSGAFFGMHAAARREVRSATLVNGPLYIWSDATRSTGTVRIALASLLDGRRWGRLLAGRIDPVHLARSLAAEARQAASRAVRRARGQPPDDPATELIRSVVSRGTKLHFVCSAGDPCIPYLDRVLPPEHTFTRSILPGVDHTVRPVWAHDRLVGLVLDPGYSDLGAAPDARVR